MFACAPVQWSKHNSCGCMTQQTRQNDLRELSKLQQAIVTAMRGGENTKSAEKFDAARSCGFRPRVLSCAYQHWE